MRTVVRNSFAHETILAERISFPLAAFIVGGGCSWCGQVHYVKNDPRTVWLYRFHVDGESARNSGPIAGGKTFCSRSCVESYIGRSLAEQKANKTRIVMHYIKRGKEMSKSKIVKCELCNEKDAVIWIRATDAEGTLLDSVAVCADGDCVCAASSLLSCGTGTQPIVEER